ncbi:hypothetical protein NP493_1002g01002 [Ridgeia piscesae]|uniref:Endonuclease/exonuclease/phosphatase domain-containing protein n=1 Tax=Ridgeia piscesae TaxID=27915 RepID=A0AAD9KIY9_RIDPI|nr:hypothetical protein NP493_1002g01002 [Ridgeia piscesae]
MGTRGRLLTLLVLLTAAWGAAEVHRERHSQRQPSLLLGAFNVQIFGARKIAKPAVLRSLGQIISRYDILLLQEIREREAIAVETLLHHLNQISTEQFRYVISERLGRTASKEQYAFFFKPSKVMATGVYQYSDPGDKFEREPFAVRFHSNSTEVGTFAVMGIHTSPRAAETELDALVPAYEATAMALDVSNIIIAGDFNADCSYVTNREWADVRLRTDSRFQWLLGDDIDTTVGSSNCAYDRFVVAGSELQAAIVPRSVIVYRFDIALDLTPGQTKNVSDHYPIQLQLEGKAIASSGVDYSTISSESLLLATDVPTQLTSVISSLRHDPSVDVRIVNGGTEIYDGLAIVVTLQKCAGGFNETLREYRRAYSELLPASLINNIWKSMWNTALRAGDNTNTQAMMSEQMTRVRACVLQYRMVAPFTCRLTIEQTIT